MASVAQNIKLLFSFLIYTPVNAGRSSSFDVAQRVLFITVLKSAAFKTIRLSVVISSIGGDGKLPDSVHDNFAEPFAHVIFNISFSNNSTVSCWSGNFCSKSLSSWLGTAVAKFALLAKGNSIVFLAVTSKLVAVMVAVLLSTSNSMSVK